MNTTIKFRGRTVTNPIASLFILMFMITWTALVIVPAAIVMSVIASVGAIVTGRIRIVRNH